MRKFKLKLGIDVDDILLSCNAYAVQLANAEYHFSPPLTIHEVEWGKQGNRSDVILKYYEQEDFFRNQPLIPGAKEFVQKLCQMGEVYFITAVNPNVMSIRAERLRREFPEVPKENLILGFCKNMVKVDILLDDGAHNILASDSAYPVLMRRPWNQYMTGCLSVNDYEEFLTLVQTITTSYLPTRPSKAKHHVMALIGPSASGKTALQEQLITEGLAVKIPSYTTRAQRANEPNDAYHFVSKKKFLEMEAAGRFFETTRYAQQCYGSCIGAFKENLGQNNVVMVVDICGAIALKKEFGEQAVLVYINRPKEDLLHAILERDCSVEEKAKRILSLSDEQKNEELCDMTVHNAGSISNMVAELKQELF